MSPPSKPPGAMGRIGETFDIERLRQNWNRVREPEAPKVVDRFAAIPAPADAIAVGREGLAKVRKMADAQLPDRVETLAPFFAQAEGALARIEAAKGEESAPDREDLLRALSDIEDLVEVFSGMGR